ncbi:hypothetical protein [uncultured Adlercreutzia sp.]|uniref:hypothetical protein n=1 Tax=uncultured Adlercreutzia sp. TaxID=875803 RepID=UPI002675E9A8|nr:hypothetical protein [uncultured Adlercreutzia sp.]
MAKKKAQHALHIKSHTHGSSNEISFSVLDAAREARDAEERDRRESGAGKVPLFTMGRTRKPHATPAKDQSIIIPEGVRPTRAGSSLAATAAAEVDRRAFRIIPVVVIVCVLLALALTIGQTLLSMRTQQNGLRGSLDENISVITNCDETLIPFDTLVMEQYDKNRLSPSAIGQKAPSFEELSEGYRQVVADIAPARAQLEASMEAIEALQPTLADNDAKEAASQAVTAARARLSMLDDGVAIIEQSLMATEAFIEAREGWKAVIDADAAAREATALLSSMSEESVNASREKTNEALSQLFQAQEAFDHAQGDYPGLDLAAVSDYVSKRIEAQQAALAADEAYLSRDKEALEAENSRYNQLEEEAASLAQALGDDPDELVASRFYDSIESFVASYEAERLKAGNADTFLRDYLGKSAQ